MLFFIDVATWNMILTDNLHHIQNCYYAVFFYILYYLPQSTLNTSVTSIPIHTVVQIV